MIKESWNLNGLKAHLAHSTKSATSLDDFLRAKKKNKDHLILSADIDDQRILHSDWMKDTNGQTKPRGSLTCYFPLMIISMQKI